MKQLLLLGILSLVSIQSQAQILKYSNEFLAIGVGARSAAMGGAVIASVNDATEPVITEVAAAPVPDPPVNEIVGAVE